MFRSKAIVLLSLWITINIGSTLKLPASFKRCKVSPELDGKRNECLTKAADEAIPALANGIKELGFLPLDPLKINEMTIEQGGSSSVAIKVHFSNCEFTGSRNAKVLEYKGKLSSPDGFHLIGTVTVPALTISGPYEITGKILVLPIEGVGHSNITMYNAKYEFHMTGEKQVKDGEDYLKITSFKMKILDPKGMKIYLENLFNGDKALGDNMNRFLNENWKDIFQEIKGAVEKAFSAVFEVSAKQIMERIAFKDIFITE